MNQRFSLSNPARPRSAALGLALALIAAACGGAATGCIESKGSGGGAGGGSAGSAGTAGSGGSGGSTGSGGTTGTLATTCESPEALKQADGSDNGFVKCKDGSFDREKSVACQLVPATDTCNLQPGYGVACQTGADCTAHPHGYCGLDPVISGFTPTCSCAYQCESDADCGVGQICACGRDGFWPSCIDAPGCKLNSDCASGECGLSFYTNGCTGTYSLECRTASDECRVVDDCAPTGSVCSKTVASGSWTCSAINCTQ